MTAYDVKAYQVSGPAWLDTERYDVAVKVRAGATKDQVKVMWQNLLAERFGVKVHHESKEFQVEELVIAKGGPKLKETAVGSGYATAAGSSSTQQQRRADQPGRRHRRFFQVRTRRLTRWPRRSRCRNWRHAGERSSPSRVGQDRAGRVIRFHPRLHDRFKRVRRCRRGRRSPHGTPARAIPGRISPPPWRRISA